MRVAWRAWWLVALLGACGDAGAGGGAASRDAAGCAGGGCEDAASADAAGVEDVPADAPEEASADVFADAPTDAAPPAPDAGDLPAPALLEEGELAPGGATTVAVQDGSAFLQEAANLSIRRRAAFQSGLQFFRLVWEPAPGRPDLDGLGPLYNAASCLGCHERNGRGLIGGDGAPSPGVLLRLGDEAGNPDPRYGDQLQPLAVPGVPPEASPRRQEEEVRSVMLPGEVEVRLRRPVYALEELAYGPLEASTRISPRIAQQLVGMGLLEAVPAEEVAAWADPEDRDGDGISGVAAWLASGELGRFGWKAGQPSVAEQTAAAFLGDLGITSPSHPAGPCVASQAACLEAPGGGEPELTRVRLEAAASYLRLLGVPARRGGEEPEVLEGKAIFAAAGCAGCHRPSLQTGSALEPELEHQRIWPYTDLLLHDMGPELADGRAEGAASGAEWRTPPLWGLGLVEEVNGARHLLHDGRAATLEEAILWHGGEGEASRRRYEALSAEARARLHRFLGSL